MVTPSSKQTIYINRQSGGALLTMVLIMLFVLMASSIHLSSRMQSNTKLSGLERDYSEAFLYTESTMELLRGRFINTLDTQANILLPACNAGNGITVDSCEAALIQKYITAPNGNIIDNGLTKYTYYVTATGINTIDQNTPSLLQRIANGEALAPNGTGMTNVVSNSIPFTTALLNIDDLFDSGNPFLYTTNANGTLIDSNAASWTALNSDIKSAAWIEVIINPNNSQNVDLYVEAVAQVGKSKRYIQSYIGSYSSQTLGAGLGGLIEASNIDRR